RPESSSGIAVVRAIRLSDRMNRSRSSIVGNVRLRPPVACPAPEPLAAPAERGGGAVGAASALDRGPVAPPPRRAAVPRRSCAPAGGGGGLFGGAPRSRARPGGPLLIALRTLLGLVGAQGGQTVLGALVALLLAFRAVSGSRSWAAVRDVAVVARLPHAVDA